MECPLCLNPYTTTTQYFPHLLHCGHTMCSSCFNFANQAKFYCPFCKKVALAEKVTKNLSLISILQTSATSTPPLVLCGSCSEKHPATKKCVDCGLFMCDSISEAHLRLRAASTHQVVSLCQVKEQIRRPYLENLQPKRCLIHDNSFEFLNSSWLSSSKTSTLSKEHSLLCSDCVEEGTFHLSRLGKASATSSLRNQLEHVRKLAPEIPKHLSVLNEKQLSLKSELVRLGDSKERTVSEIRRVFSGLMECLTSRQLELESQVEEVYKAGMFELEEHRDRCGVWTGQLGLLSECVRELEGWVSQVVGESSGSVSNASESPPSSDPLSVSLTRDKELMVDICLLDSALSHSFESLSSSDSVLAPSLDPASPFIEFSTVQQQPTPSLRSKLMKTQPEPSSPPLDLPKLVSSFGSVQGPECWRRRADLNPWTEGQPTRVMEIPTLGDYKLNEPRCLRYREDLDELSLSCAGLDKILKFRMRETSKDLSTSSSSFSSSTALSVECLGEISLPASTSSSSSSFSSGSSTSEPCTHPSPSPCSPCGFVYHRNWLIVVDSCNSRVLIWDCEKNCFLRSFNSSGDHLWGCVVNGEELIISDIYDNRISFHSLSDGKWIAEMIDGSITTPRGMIMVDGLLYVANTEADRIDVMDPNTGQIIKQFESYFPFDLLHHNGLLFVSTCGYIRVHTIEGELLYSFGKSPDQEEEDIEQSFYGMAMVKERLYALDWENHKIVVFEPKKN